MNNIKQYGRVFALCCLYITLGCAGNKNGNGGGDPNTPPAVPQNFTAMASDRQVTLSWNTEPNLIYELYYSTETGFALENGTKIAPVTSPYVHMGLTNETTYYYRLTANNSAGASEPTPEVSATPAPNAPPAPPQNFTATAFDRQVTLSWNTEPDVIYELYHSTETEFALENGTKIAPVTSPYVHTGLTNDVTYYYLLRAVNSFGASVPTAEVSARTPGPPETPRNFTAIIASDRQVTLSWTAEEGVTYELFHSRTQHASFNSGMPITILSPPYTHTGLTNDVAYYYTLRAVNSFGASVPTAEIFAIPVPSARPERPQGFMAMASDGQITLSWTEIVGLRYVLTYSRTAGLTGLYISPVTSPYIHMGLTNDVTYYYRLRAVNSLGFSRFTGEISATPVPSAPPAPPENFMATAFDRQVTLEWDSQDGLTYDLFHSTTPGIDVNDMNVMKISGVTSPYPHTGLSDNTTYYYRLRAVNSFDASLPTAEISATPMPPPQPAAPQNFMAATSSGQVRLTWRSQLGETYDLFHSTSEGFILENGTKVSSVTPPYIHRNLMDSTRYYYRLRAENRLDTGPPTAEISAITPTPLSAAKISAGYFHTCAVVNGRALCWGESTSGRLGNNNSEDDQNTPVSVSDP